MIKDFKGIPEIARLKVMLFVGYPLSLRNVEDLLQVWGIEVGHQTMRYWWNKFGPLLASEFRKKLCQ